MAKGKAAGLQYVPLRKRLRGRRAERQTLTRPSDWPLKKEETPSEKQELKETAGSWNNEELYSPKSDGSPVTVSPMIAKP